jgi:RNA polymerase sigma factor (sigma-70 family)
MTGIDFSNMPTSAGSTTLHNYQIMDLMNAHESVLLRFVVQLLWPDEAAGRDVVQLTFIKCHRYILKNGPDSIENPKAWLFRVARNLCMDTLRRLQRKKKAEAAMVDDPAVGGKLANNDLQARQSAEVYDLMMTEVGSLPYEVREILVMKHIQGMTLQEISNQTGLKMGTVGYRIKQGLAILAKRLREQRVEDRP